LEERKSGYSQKVGDFFSAGVDSFGIFIIVTITFMQKIIFLFTFYLLVELVSCKPVTRKSSQEEKWDQLPEVTNINSFKRTEFVPTLESSISDSNNIIYASALLYAWDKVKQKINSQILLSDSNSFDFKKLNQSASFQNTLKEDEYSAEAQVSDDMIIARAFFHKSLPFPSKLQKINTPIIFDKNKVKAFGMETFDEAAIEFSEILYYKDDDNFIFRLNPKDSSHEIILIKGIRNIVSFSDAIERIDSLIKSGNKEKTNSKESWKYSINETDVFAIPLIQFNIEKYYKTLEGQPFEVNNKKLYIAAAYQRTGFILNENGAIVESEAIMSTDTSAIEPVKTHPKRMIFDKPFFIIVKRANSDNPYFMMKVENSELLIKE